MRALLLAALLSLVAAFSISPPNFECTRRSASSKSHRAAAPSMGFFDDVKETFREVTVQHVLVNSQSEAIQIYEALLEEGPSPEAVGRYAVAKSTCGSAKKTPDKKLAQLRGMPGELKFRRGSMAPEFESAAFAASPGTLVKPFSTSFGWHVMLVNE